jgi:AcrR family transcriptional regulator
MSRPLDALDARIASMAGMPRIEADTVAEHRAQQHDALLDAAQEILLREGYEALSFRTLGERTGLARNSIYRYFTSRDEVIGELCERDMPRWLAEVDRAMDRADTVAAKVEAFVRAQLKMLVGGHHRMAAVIGDAPLGPEARARINALAYAPAVHLERVLEEAGHPRPHVTAQLVQGIVNAAFRLLQGRGDEAEVVAATADAARRAVAT